MERGVDKSVARVSALTYTGLSLTVAGLVLLVARWLGGYPPAAMYGGAVWSFLLSMIVTTPVVTAYFKRRAKTEA